MASDVDADVVRVRVSDVVVLGRVELHADVIREVAAGGEDEEEAVAVAGDGEGELRGERRGVREGEWLPAAEDAGGGRRGAREPHVGVGVGGGDNVGVAEEVDAVGV